MSNARGRDYRPHQTTDSDLTAVVHKELSRLSTSFQVPAITIHSMLPVSRRRWSDVRHTRPLDGALAHWGE